MLAFQPHRYTRTRDLFEDFVQVLSTVDALVLADVYPAGEAPIVAADGRALARARARRRQGRAGVRRGRRRRARGDRARIVRDGDVVLTMGAGSIGAGAGAAGGRHDDERAARSSRRCAARSTRDAPLARYTSWRCGGPRRSALRAGRSRRPRGVPAAAAAASEPLTVLGLGSNLLVRDGGVRGTVVVMHNAGATRSRSPTASIYAEAGGRVPEARALRRDARLRRARSSWPAFPAPSAARSR